MTRQDPTAANIAIIKALGIDPSHIRKGATITLDKNGPVLTVKYILLNNEGKMYTINDDLATELKRYKLVPIDDDVTTG